LSQKSLATKAGIPQSLISYIETGSIKNPGIGTLQKIAKALDVPVTDLLEEAI